MIGKLKLIEETAKTMGAPKTEVTRVYNALQETVMNLLRDDEAVKVCEGLVLKPKVKASFKTRNPQTGEQMIVPERKLVRASFGRVFKELYD